MRRCSAHIPFVFFLSFSLPIFVYPFICLLTYFRSFSSFSPISRYRSSWKLLPHPSVQHTHTCLTLSGPCEAFAVAPLHIRASNVLMPRAPCTSAPVVNPPHLGKAGISQDRRRTTHFFHSLRRYFPSSHLYRARSHFSTCT